MASWLYFRRSRPSSFSWVGKRINLLSGISLLVVQSWSQRSPLVVVPRDCTFKTLTVSLDSLSLIPIVVESVGRAVPLEASCHRWHVYRYCDRAAVRNAL